MINDIGFYALSIAFVLAVYSTAASALGGRNGRATWVESARAAALLVFPLLTISVISVVVSLLSLNFSIAYVSEVSSQAMSPFLRVTALWGGQSGSVLFWAWLMAGIVATVLLFRWREDRELMPYVTSVCMLTTAFFIGVVVFITNPFFRIWHVAGAEDVITAFLQPANAMPYIPADGGGLNPLLRHFGMIGHPPTTYLGFTGFVVPFAFAVAALVTGRAGEDRWIRSTRTWSLVAWVFLSIGLVLGGRWAYDVLGWGGFWGWDPVENAMLMPWLTATAFLHSVMMTEKRGMMKKWNMVLIILTYSLSLFGTFITRTGVVGSVHAFSKSALGPAFFVFIGVTFLGSVFLLLRRWDSLKGEHELESFASRETIFVLQNLLFLSITIAVFWGTVFPLLTELISNTKITVGPPFFKQVTGPLFFALLLTMGLAPLFAWRKQNLRSLLRMLAIPFAGSLLLGGVWGYTHRMHLASISGLWLVSFVSLVILSEYIKGVRARMKSRGENPLVALIRLVSRNHRRYGGYLIHLAVLMIALGFIGDTFFKQETQGTLAPGESLKLGSYSLRFDSLDQYPGSDGRQITVANTTLFKDGKPVRLLYPRQDYFTTQQQNSTIAALYSTPAEDVYILLAGWEQLGEGATTFKIYINPLINWVWLGGVLMVLGILIAVWPSGKNQAAGYVIKPEVLPSHQPQAGD